MEFGLQVGGMPVAALRELAALADDGGFRWRTVPDHFVLEEPGSRRDAATIGRFVREILPHV